MTAPSILAFAREQSLKLMEEIRETWPTVPGPDAWALKLRIEALIVEGANMTAEEAHRRVRGVYCVKSLEVIAELKASLSGEKGGTNG